MALVILRYPLSLSAQVVQQYLEVLAIKKKMKQYVTSLNSWGSYDIIVAMLIDLAKWGNMFITCMLDSQCFLVNHMWNIAMSDKFCFWDTKYVCAVGQKQFVSSTHRKHVTLVSQCFPWKFSHPWKQVAKHISGNTLPCLAKA